MCKNPMVIRQELLAKNSVTRPMKCIVSIKYKSYLAEIKKNTHLDKQALSQPSLSHDSHISH